MTRAIENALREFELTLDDDARLSFRAHSLSFGIVPGEQSVLQFTAELDAVCARNQRRCVSNRAFAFLSSIQQFTTVVDTFVSAHPEVPALIWGSIKFTLMSIVNVSTYFDKVSELLMRLRDRCPRLTEYKSIFRFSTRLQNALSEYFAAVVKACQRIVTISHRTAFTQLTFAIWKPFELDFDEILKSLQQKFQVVKEEIQLASEQAHYKERQAMKGFRKEQKLTQYQMKQAILAFSRHQEDARKEHTLRAISKHDYKLVFNQNLKKRIGQSCNWLAVSPEYHSVMQNQASATLWYRGKMGSGKSVLCAHLVQNLSANLDQKQRRVIYFFCHTAFEDSLKASTLFCCLLKQIVSPANMSSETEEALKLLGEGSMPDVKGSRKLLERVCEGQKLAIVIDGIDHCQREDQNIVLNFLGMVLNKQSSDVKLFITSRFDLRDSFSRHSIHFSQCNPTENDIEAAITTFIDGAVDEKLENGLLKAHDGMLVEEIKTKLREGADRTFLWASLVIDIICSELTDYDIRSALTHLPRSLEEIYVSIVEVIMRSYHQEMVRKEFMWIAVAMRPLTLLELREAIVIEECQSSRRTEKYLNDPSDLVKCAGGLLYLDEEQETLQFSHRSVKTFLTTFRRNQGLDNFQINTEESETFVGQCCLAYLNFSDFERQIIRHRKDFHIEPLDIADTAIHAHGRSIIGRNGLRILRNYVKSTRKTINNDADTIARLEGIVGTKQESNDLSDQYPFLSYAKCYWAVHSKNFTPDTSKSWSRFEKLVLEGSEIAETPWNRELWDAKPLQSLNPVMKMSSKDLRRWLIHHKHQGLLHLGYMTYGPEAFVFDVAIDLLEESPDELYTIALQLLDRSSQLGKLLKVVAERGLVLHFEVVMDLIYSQKQRWLSYRVDLAWLVEIAAEKGQTKFMEYLMSIPSQCKPYNSPGTEFSKLTPPQRIRLIHLAIAKNRSISVIKMLLHSAMDNIEHKTFTGSFQADLERMLSLAILGRRLRTLRLLLKAGVGGWSSESLAHLLLLAVGIGHVRITRCLLNAGANQFYGISCSRSPIYMAAGNPNSKLLRVLFEHDDEQIFLNHIASGRAYDAGNYSCTPLHVAVHRRLKRNVQILLEVGADANERDHRGFTAKHLAINLLWGWGMQNIPDGRPQIPLDLDNGSS